MKVEQDQIYNLLQKPNIVLKIPVFQRPYVWNENIHVKTLLDDIESLLNNPTHVHFLGTAVYLVEQDSNSNYQNYLIVDGQQRITTLYILFKALSDSLDENHDQFYKNLIVDDILKNKRGTIRGNELNPDKLNVWRLQMTPNDNKSLLSLMEGSNDLNPNTHISKNYNYIKNRISNWLKTFTPYEIDTALKNLYYVEIRLDKTDNAQKIFASLNSTGKELNYSDLVRNLFLLEEENMEYLYNQYWKKIEDLIERDSNDGKILDDYLMHFLEARSGRYVNKRDIYSRFNEIIDNGENPNDLLKEVYEKAQIYHTILYPDDSNYSQKIKELLLYFKMINTKTVYPLLLNILNDLKKPQLKRETVEKVLSLILSYIVRKQISNNSTKGFNRFFASFYKKAFDNTQIEDSDYYDRIQAIFQEENSKDSYFPDDIETKANLENLGLYNISTLRLPLLLALENSGPDKIDYSNLTVEHVMPQKMTEDWVKMVNTSKENYQSVLHTIGNLTLISKNSNSKLSNKNFEQKKAIIRANAKANILNSDILDKNKWDISTIKKRTQRLSELLTDIFPDIERPEINKEKSYKELPLVTQNNQEEDSSNNINDEISDLENLKIHLSQHIKALDFQVEAFGELSSSGLKVLKGSKISPHCDSTIAKSVLKARNKVEIKDNVLMNDILFSTPSGAAQFVTGKSSNGWILWKTEKNEKIDKFRKYYETK